MRGLLIVALLAPSAVQAAQTASFLDVGVGARALSLGGAGTAFADDATALYWNPSRLAQVEKRESVFSHAELAESTRLDFGGYVHPIKQGALGAGVTYLSHGSISGRDGQGRPTAGFGASDAALALAYARKEEIGRVGVALKYIRRHIAEAEAQTVAFDVGLSKAGDLGGWKSEMGLTLRNVGPGLRYVDQKNDLPLTAAFGLLFRKGHLGLGLDYENRPRIGGNDAAVGLEYEAMPGVYLRSGYGTLGAAEGGSGFDAVRGLAFGFGAKMGSLRLDYGIKPMGELGRAHRFDVGCRF
ncbi:MAG: PorV/PorQ family protein [Elusimicrobia bacterium]|nr:PorV/PorQ family protein [Elusimicrobiota bacterium]